MSIVTRELERLCSFPDSRKTSPAEMIAFTKKKSDKERTMPSVKISLSATLRNCVRVHQREQGIRSDLEVAKCVSENARKALSPEDQVLWRSMEAKGFTINGKNVVIEEPEFGDVDVPVVSRDGKLTGYTTGVRQPCRLAGCRGVRIGVAWPGGKRSKPCSKGLDRCGTGWKII